MGFVVIERSKRWMLAQSWPVFEVDDSAFPLLSSSLPACLLASFQLHRPIQFSARKGKKRKRLCFQNSNKYLKRRI